MWCATECNIDPFFSKFRDYPASYEGYYIDVADIKDIEAYVKETNKRKYKGVRR